VATVAFVVNPDRPEAAALAEGASRWLEAQGHTVDLVGDERLLPGDHARTPHAPTAVATLGEGVDLAVSLGGDGTMLRTVALACVGGIPVLGVNLGRLGYLTEVEPAGLHGALERFLAGDYSIEERLTLDVHIERAGADSRPGAPAPHVHRVLNEVVVEKTVPGHTVSLATSIAGRPFVTYAADGVLVATPTGSTAYNLSAHGPILSPLLRALVMTPLAPHTLFDRPLVLGPEQAVRIEVAGPRPAVLVLDGRSVDALGPGDAVACRGGASPARLVIFGPRDFHAILRARFNLADR